MPFTALPRSIGPVGTEFEGPTRHADPCRTVTGVQTGGDSLVWYAAYGSNCSFDRFRTYLEGGTPPGATHVQRGARDPAAPRADGPIRFPSAVCFRGHSTWWGGAPAFLEHAPSTRGALGRRYLITVEQFEDVLAQENRLEVVSPVAVDRPPGDRQRVTDGPYGQVVSLEPIDGHPVLTFTSPAAPEHREPAAPSAAYLGTIVRGLAEVHELTPLEIADHLLMASGVDSLWNRRAIVGLFSTN